MRGKKRGGNGEERRKKKREKEITVESVRGKWEEMMSSTGMEEVGKIGMC